MNVLSFSIKTWQIFANDPFRIGHGFTVFPAAFFPLLPPCSFLFFPSVPLFMFSGVSFVIRTLIWVQSIFVPLKALILSGFVGEETTALSAERLLWLENFAWLMTQQPKRALTGTILLFDLSWIIRTLARVNPCQFYVNKLNARDLKNLWRGFISNRLLFFEDLSCENE